ncbi:hypothetical protein [Streptomyces longisporoflavus]|uniref:Glycosyl hydrolase n=1 Tax=Streptomyces longisporoflavus TaxID=28044 RepID=A0ABW7QIM1_9ACTN
MTSDNPMHGWESVGPYVEGVPSAAVTALAVSQQALCVGTDKGMLRTPLPIPGPDWPTASGEEKWAFTGNYVVDIQAWASQPSVLWRTRRFGTECATELSTDAGRLWHRRGSFHDAIFAVHIDPDDYERVMHSFGRLGPEGEVLGVRTTDFGMFGGEWVEHEHGRFYTQLTADLNVPGRIWMASGTNGLYSTDDFGVATDQATGEEANAVIVSGSRLLIGGDTIRYREDGETVFHEAALKGITGPVRVVALAQYDTVLFAATTSLESPGQPVTAGHGVLRSPDNGSTWQSISGNLPTLDVHALAVDPTEQYLYAGLWGGSVHRLPLT